MNNHLKLVREAQSRYAKGENILSFLKDENKTCRNNVESIAISYDLQAGSYIQGANRNHEYVNRYTRAIASILSSLKPDCIMEVGVGEATTLCNVVKQMRQLPQKALGFDISWSRVKYAQSYASMTGVSHLVSLFVADLFSIPALDDSVDVVFTSHSLEPNGGREREALIELYRVARRYVVLLEPAYDLAKPEAKRRMEQHGYVTRLHETIIELGWNIAEHRLFDCCSNPLNPTGLHIIEKPTSTAASDSVLACPISHTKLSLARGHYFSPESLLLYPVIDGVPCLHPSNAVVASHYMDFEHSGTSGCQDARANS